MDIAGDDDIPRMDRRRIELADMSVAELVERLLTLEYEVSLLAGGARRPLCGDVYGGVSCQLFRGHQGLHAWGSPQQDTFVRW